LLGESIPLGSRIIACADAYASIRCDRPYRRGSSTRAALTEIRACAGTQFDPEVVGALEALARGIHIAADRVRPRTNRASRLVALLLILSIGATGAALARSGVIPGPKGVHSVSQPAPVTPRPTKTHATGVPPSAAARPLRVPALVPNRAVTPQSQRKRSAHRPGPRQPVNQHPVQQSGGGSIGLPSASGTQATPTGEAPTANQGAGQGQSHAYGHTKAHGNPHGQGQGSGDANGAAGQATETGNGNGNGNAASTPKPPKAPKAPKPPKPGKPSNPGNSAVSVPASGNGNGNAGGNGNGNAGGNGHGNGNGDGDSG
jgi:hypothetical protein